MKTKDLPYLPEFFDRYINLVPEELDLLDALESFKTVFDDLEDIIIPYENFRYEEGKWTPKDIIQHIIDTERILSYRALAFSRGDINVLPGFDEERYARNTTAANRTVSDLLKEFKIVRSATIQLFKNMTDTMLLGEGICFNQKITSLALGFVIIGHPLHHINTLKERYFV